MSPVHVIVGDDPRAERMWAEAFAGAVDLYRFDRNAEAFERLTAAEAPIDLVVLTPAQGGPFNLTPDQFVARVLDGAIGATRCLANLHVIVVGQPLASTHPRAMSVSTLDAAIRLVKFGEIERAPRPAVAAPVAAQPVHDVAHSASRAVDDELGRLVGNSSIADALISRIWDAGDAAARAQMEPPRSTTSPSADDVAAPVGAVQGGGATRARSLADAEALQAAHAAEQAARRTPAVSQPAVQPLFSRAAPAGFVVSPQQLAAPVQGHVAQMAPGHQVVGGGVEGGQQLHVGAPGEQVVVGSGLQAARQYQLPSGGGYRGAAVRGTVPVAASHGIGSPVPPALAAQVQQVVYGTAGRVVADPMLTWSSSSRGQIVTHGVPVPGAQPAAPPVAGGGPGVAPQSLTQPAAVMSAVQQHAPQVVRTVPMEPPSGAYGGPVAPTDPHLQRLESRGAAVSFG